MKKFLKLFLKVDIFGKTAHFHINGKKKYKTYLGSIFTIIAFLLSFTIIIILSKDVLLHQNLIVLTTIDNSYKSRIENISTNSFIFALSLQDQNYTNYIDESIYYLNASIHDTKRNKDGISKIDITNLKLTRCNLLDISILPNYFQAIGMKNLYCLNESNIILKGDFGEIDWRYLIFQFSKCKNTTENNFSCKSINEINDKLKDGYFGAFMTDLIITNTDFEKPFSQYGKNFFTSFSINQYQDLWVYLKKIQVITDSGYLFEDKKLEENIALDKYESTIDYREQNNFYSVKIRLTNKIEIYERSYKKIPEAICNIGGFMKIILLLCKFIVSFCNDLLFKKFLIQFFKFEDNDNIYKNLFNSKNFSTLTPNNLSNVNSNVNNSNIKLDNNNVGNNSNNYHSEFNFPKIKLISGSINFCYKKFLSEKKKNYNNVPNSSPKTRKYFLSKIHTKKKKNYRLCFQIYCKKKGLEKAKAIYKKFKSISFLTDIIYYYKSLFKIQLLEYSFFDINKRHIILDTDYFDFYFFNEEKINYEKKNNKHVILNLPNYNKYKDEIFYS